MMDLKQAFKQPRLMLTLTGLKPDEFQTLAATFALVWEEQVQKTRVGQPRQRAAGAGPPCHLATPELKLLFILVYLRLYPLQAVLGFFFGFTQSQANK